MFLETGTFFQISLINKKLNSISFHFHFIVYFYRDNAQFKVIAPELANS